MNRILSILFIFLCLLLPGCFDETRDPAALPLIEVSLYTGIPGIAKLGDSYNNVSNETRFSFQKTSIDPDSELGKLGFIELLQYKDIGSRVYMKRDGVGLITAQEPFKGNVKGKHINLFTFSVPPVSNWESHLLKELGQPEVRASGGRFGSEALFYAWGDISYNRMGPNEIALYRNPELARYRQKNFGRELTLFPGK